MTWKLSDSVLLICLQSSRCIPDIQPHSVCLLVFTSSSFILINLFIYLFWAVLGLCCCARAFSSCGERGLLFLVVRGLLTAVVSLVAEHRLQARGLQQLWHVGSVIVARRLSSCGALALLLRSMWDLPGPGLEPVSPALAGRFLTTASPGKSLFQLYFFLLSFRHKNTYVY